MTETLQMSEELKVLLHFSKADIVGIIIRGFFCDKHGGGVRAP
jgi:hypothetical protein